MNAILLFRWLTFLLAAGVSVYVALFGSYAEIGGPYRYLAVWTLFASFFCASRLIAQTEGRVEARFDRVIAATAALNAVVVFVYCKLIWTDPATVLRPGDARSFPVEVYLYAIGPALQIFDAVVLHRAFRKPLHSAVIVVGTLGLYVLWIEGAVRAVNIVPTGRMTSGLPYPFLNDLEAGERALVYAVGLVFGLSVLALLTLGGRRWGGLPATDPPSGVA